MEAMPERRTAPARTVVSDLFIRTFLRPFLRLYLRTTNDQFLLTPQRFTSCGSRKLGGVNGSRSHEGGNARPAFFGQEIAVRSRNFMDQTVGAEHAQLARHCPRLATQGFRIRRRFAVQPLAQVAVAKAIHQELAAVDRLQQLRILCRQRVERPHAMLFPANRPTQSDRQLAQKRGVLRRRQRIQVTLVRRLAYFRPTMSIGHAATQGAPRFLTLGIALARAIDLDVVRIVQGRLDPQDRSLLVIHLDRVRVQAMFDPKALGTFAQVAHHFADELSRYATSGRKTPPQKTQDLPAA